MRIVFLILLTANLGWLLWYTQIKLPQQQSGLPEIPRNVKRLELVSEQTTSEPQAQPDNAVEQSTDAENSAQTGLPEIEIVDDQGVALSAIKAQPQCFTLGPYKNDKQRDAARKRFSALGITTEQRQNTESELFGYRVYLSPLPSREKAVAVTRELAEHGINDYFIIHDEDKRNGISLGLFRNKDGAIRRMAAVRRFGFTPQMEVRNREQVIYWLDIQADDGQFNDALWRELSEGQPELQRLKRECPTEEVLNDG